MPSRREACFVGYVLPLIEGSSVAGEFIRKGGEEWPEGYDARRILGPCAAMSLP